MDGGPSNARSKSFGMVTSFYDDYYLVGEPPSDFSNSAYSNPDDSDEFTNSTNKSHQLNIIGADLTEQERKPLPESFLSVCKDKPIKNVTKVVVNEEGFDDDNFDNVDGRSRALPRDNSLEQKIIIFFRQGVRNLTEDVISIGQILQEELMFEFIPSLIHCNAWHAVMEEKQLTFAIVMI